MARRQLVALAVGLGLVGLLVPSGVPVAAQAQVPKEAERVLSQARAALGGADRLASVKALSLAGKMRRVIQANDATNQLSGDLEIDVVLPDKYLRTDTTIMGPASVIRSEGFNGSDHLSDSRTLGGPGMIMRFTTPDDPKLIAAQVRRLQEECARLTLAWLLTGVAQVPIQFSYAGQAESPDGKADVLDVKDGVGFSARLFLDTQTHLPLMMTYQTPELRVQMVTMRAEGGRAPSKEDRDKLLKEAQEKAKAAQAAPVKLVEARLYFSDYRKVNRIQFPFQVTREVDGKPSEEWEIQKYTVNPPAKPEKFEVKK